MKLPQLVSTFPAFVLLFLVLAATNFSAHGQGGTKAQDAKSENAQARESSSPIPNTLYRQSKPNMYLPDCTRPKDHDQADLCQQIRMAEAAEDAAKIAWEQYRVGILGFLALLATLALNVRATRAATRAALAAEKAVSELEQPRVYVEVSSAGLKVDPVDGSYTFAGQRVEYQCVNYGRTPADIIEYLANFRVLRAGVFPGAIDLKKTKGRTLPAGCVAAEGMPYVEGDAAMKVYDWKLLNPRAYRKYDVFLIGFVRYRDIFEATYLNGFCLVYDPIGARFVRRGDEKYNYTKQEKQPTRSQRLKASAQRTWAVIKHRAPRSASGTNSTKSAS